MKRLSNLLCMERCKCLGLLKLFLSYASVYLRPVLSLSFTNCLQLIIRIQLCDIMDCGTPGFPVLHYLPEFAQTHVPWVDDSIQLSHPLSSPSPPAFNLSQHQGLSLWVISSYQVAKVLELQLPASVLPMNIQDWFPLGLTGLISLQSKGLSRVFWTPKFKNIKSSALSFLYGTTVTSIHDYWKNHSFDQTDLCWPSNVSAF